MLSFLVLPGLQAMLHELNAVLPGAQVLLPGTQALLPGVLLSREGPLAGRGCDDLISSDDMFSSPLARLALSSSGRSLFANLSFVGPAQ